MEPLANQISPDLVAPRDRDSCCASIAGARAHPWHPGRSDFAGTCGVVSAGPQADPLRR